MNQPNEPSICIAPSSELVALIRANKTAVLDRIHHASGVNQPPLLLAVSKAQPAQTLAAAVICGQRHFGENYLQEAVEKIKAITQWQEERGDTAPLYWHYIGNVQSNKTRALAEHFDWVHTVTSHKQLKRLSEQRLETQLPLNICIQVNIDHEHQKQGVDPSEAKTLCESALEYPRLKLRGLMSLPAQEKGATSFKALADLMQSIKQHSSVLGSDQSAFDTLSMGMSADLEDAVKAGSTVVRVGTALFGTRNQ